MKESNSDDGRSLVGAAFACVCLVVVVFVVRWVLLGALALAASVLGYE